MREGERHRQGEAGSAQAQEAALTRRGRRCHERGKESCHVPDMNPRIARSCTGRTDVYTAVRRSLIALSQSSAPFQSGGRNGPFKCLTINYSEHLCTRTQGTHYLDDPPVSRIEHGSSGLDATGWRTAEQARAQRHSHLQHDQDQLQGGCDCSVKNGKFDDALRTRHGAPATRNSESPRHAAGKEPAGG